MKNFLFLKMKVKKAKKEVQQNQNAEEKVYIKILQYENPKKNQWSYIK